MMSNPKPRILLVVPDPTRQRPVRTALSRGRALVATEESGEAVSMVARNGRRSASFSRRLTRRDRPRDGLGLDLCLYCA